MLEALWLTLLWLGAVFLVPLLIYLYFCVRFYIAQPGLLFANHLDVDVESPDDDFEYRDMTYRTADGLRIRARYVPAPDVPSPTEKKRGVVLFCHGNAGHLGQRTDTFHIFRRLGLDTFIFDYRGYGLSEGTPDEKGTYLDAEGAWHYLVTQLGADPGEIIVFGRSLGGAVAAYLARTFRPRALVIESSFSSAADLAADLFPAFPARLLTRYKYNTLKRLKHIHCPVLIVHSPEDRLISFKHGLRMYEAANPPKGFLRISGDHRDGFLRSPNYIGGLETFIDSL